MKLKPCPRCGSLDYDYCGESPEELTNPVFYMRAIWFGWRQGWNPDNLKESPLLMCQSCRSTVIACPYCGHYISRPILTSTPTRSLIHCPNCRRQFTSCERSDDWDDLLQGGEGQRTEGGQYSEEDTKDERDTRRHPRDFWLEILDLRSNATPDEIRKRYRELIRTAHPDHGGNTHHFRMIRKAYENLVDD